MSWKSVQIGSLGKVVTGNTPPKKNPEYYGSAYKFIKPTDMNIGARYTFHTDECYSVEAYNKYIKSLIPPLSTCVVTIGSIGQKMTITSENCFVNQAVNAVIPNDNYNPYFVYYALKNILLKIKNADTGASSGRENVSKSNFMSLSLEVPDSLKIQKKIADMLSAYDDLIENNLKRIKLLEEAAQNIYKEWFVNFRFPNHENTPINEQTGLPSGWKKVELQSISTVQSSKRVFLSDYVEIGVPFYRGKEITQKSKFEDVSEPLFISEEKFSELEEKSGSPKKNDILITAVGTIGNCYLVKENDLPFYFKDGNLIRLHSYKDGMSGLFLIHYLQSHIFMGVVNSISIGSSQKALTITALKKIEITLPTNDLIVQYDSVVSSFVKQIDILGETTKKLKEARDILLPRLMNRTIKI